MARTWAIVLIAALTAVLAACAPPARDTTAEKPANVQHAGDGSPGTPTGDITLSVAWPRSALTSRTSRRALIPASTEWIRACVEDIGGTIVACSDIVSPDTGTVMADIPIGDYTIMGTAWREVPNLGSVELLAFGSESVTVLSDTTASASVTLGAADVSFTSPDRLVYGTANSQSVTMGLQSSGWPLSMEQAHAVFYLTDADYPSTITRFDEICDVPQILTDPTGFRSCSGQLASTSGYAGGSLQAVVFVHPHTFLRDFGNGPTLLPEGEGKVTTIQVLSGAIPANE